MDAKIGDWDDLRFFLAVARGGGLSAAARVVGCEASTVQRRMQRFEHSWSITCTTACSRSCRCSKESARSARDGGRRGSALRWASRRPSDT